MRTKKFSLSQAELLLQEQLLDFNKQIQNGQRSCARFEQFMNSESSNISKDEFETFRDDIEYLAVCKKLLTELIPQENLLREQQEQGIDESIEHTNRSLEILVHKTDSLEVCAPIDSRLSAMDAEIM